MQSAQELSIISNQSKGSINHKSNYYQKRNLVGDFPVSFASEHGIINQNKSMPTLFSKELMKNNQTNDRVSLAAARKTFIEQYLKSNLVLVGIKKDYDYEHKTVKETYELYLSKTVGDEKEENAIKNSHKIFLNPENIFIRNIMIRPPLFLHLCMEFSYFDRLRVKYFEYKFNIIRSLIYRI